MDESYSPSERSLKWQTGFAFRAGQARRGMQPDADMVTTSDGF
jgi:hypothetical protein